MLKICHGMGTEGKLEKGHFLNDTRHAIDCGTWRSLLADCSARLAFVIPRIILLLMATIAEVEKLALDLPESQRAGLSAQLLRSLPSVLHDEDEGIAEALRRDAELDANPLAGISLEQLEERIERRRS
jgi:hypothetical protein